MTEPIQRVPKTGWLGSAMYLFFAPSHNQIIRRKKSTQKYILLLFDLSELMFILICER